MTSTITNTSNLININFPGAGAAITGVTDFHKNFRYITESFNTLIKEYEILEKDLANIQKINNFGGKLLQNAVFSNTSYVVNDIGIIESGVIELDYSQGIYHKCLINNGYFLFNITNWPVNNTKGWLRLEIKNNSETTSTSSKLYFSGNINYIGNSSFNYTLPPNEICVFDIWTYNNGNNINVKPLGISAGVLNTLTSVISSGSPVASGNLPFITYTNPQQAAASGGTIMSVVGGNFGASPSIIINGNQTGIISSNSPTEIYFYTRAGMGGEYQTVLVRTNVGDSNLVGYYLYEDATGE